MNLLLAALYRKLISTWCGFYPVIRHALTMVRRPSGPGKEPEVQTAAETILTHLNRRYRPALMSFFLRRVRNHAEAEDLTQEVFVRLAASEGSASIQQPDGYIFRTAANLLRDKGRRDKVRADSVDTVRAYQGEPFECLDPQRCAIGREALEAAIAALRELNERTRAIFILSRLENMKQREIAELLGISVSAVEKHMVRATAHISQRLKQT